METDKNKRIKGRNLSFTQTLYNKYYTTNEIVDEAKRIHKIKKLLFYCGQDSLAMVRIYEELKNIL